MAKLSTSEISAIVSAARADALSAERASKLSEDRARAMDYYLGDMSDDMAAQPDRSSAVSRDVSDVVEGLMPALMEIFFGSDDVVEFEPQGQEDEEAAAQETDYVNYVFTRRNDGFRVLYTMIKDALLQKVGFAKVWWQPEQIGEEETYEDLDDAAFAILRDDPDVEIIEHTERGEIEFPAGSPQIEDGVPEMPDPVSMVSYHDVVVRTVETRGQAKVEAVPPEEIGIDRSAKTIRDANYMFHETRRHVADLLDEGYDKAQVESLTTTDPYGTTPEAESRNTVDEWNFGESEGMNQTARLVRVTEHYIRLDMRDDGNFALYKIVTGGEGGKTILNKDGKPDIEEIRYFPFAAMSPIIQPHRFVGLSIADMVIDIQRIKTSLTRALLDNVYLASNQRIEVSASHAGDHTIDDLLTNRPGSIVRTKQPGGLMPIPSTSIGNFAFPMVEYYDNVREWRTGVTKQGAGLQPNALQNIGENAILDAANAARAKQKLIARIFAETGITDLFLLLHAVIRENDDKENTVRLRGKWTAINPREWKTRENMSINVALGDGSKQQQMSFLMMILGAQKEALAQPQLGLVTPGHLYNTLKRMTEMAGQKSVDPYFMDPDEKGPDGNPMRQPAQPAPDPKLAEMQARMELEKVQAQSDIAAQQEKTKAEIAQKMEEAKIKAAAEQAKAQFDLQQRQLDLQQRATEARMEAERRNAEFAMKMQEEGKRLEAQLAAIDRKAQADLELKREEFALKRELMLLEAEINGVKAAADVERDDMTAAADAMRKDAESEAGRDNEGLPNDD